MTDRNVIRIHLFVCTGILRAGLPQLSLTVFNSVVSVCALSEEMFPHRPASTVAVASSVGLMNLVGCWFGAYPSCHGAGGLAGQVKSPFSVANNILALYLCAYQTHIDSFNTINIQVLRIKRDQNLIKNV